MARRAVIMNSSNTSRISMNGSEQTSETEMHVSFQMPQPLTPEQFRTIRDALRQAGIEFECSDDGQGGCTFGFSARSRRSSA